LTGLYNLTTKSSWWIRIVILSGITLIYIISFQAFYTTTGYIGPALSILPIVAAGWLFGKWAGLLSGILIVPLVIWLFSTVGITEWEKIVNRWPGVFIGALIGGMIGWLKDLLGDLNKRSLELLHSQRHLKQQYERLSALRSIDMIITASLDLKITFNMFLDQVISQLKVDAADILMNSPDHKLEYVDGRGFNTLALQHSRLFWGEGHAGRAAQEKRIVIIKNLNTSEEIFRRSPLLAQEGFITYLGQPLIAKDQVVGVLEVFTRFPFEPDQDWLDFFDALTARAAIAIDNAKLFTDLQKSNRELLQAYDTTIEGWSRALDLRDKETEGHSRRVTEMTVQIAQAWENICDNDLRYIRWGSLLHDIGKMGIPDSILLKSGPLSKGEAEIIQKHPLYAYNLLYPIPFLRPALDIPYCHHEKWDGTGYPRGLKGDQIPLPARIFAVIDTWDALCSDRPYRPAWPKEKAFSYIQEQAGKNFDPGVVKVFVNCV
jgi:HD-GYP domain-containing protein (c-di-GMP phosphodiesterase class II)